MDIPDKILVQLEAVLGLPLFLQPPERVYRLEKPGQGWLTSSCDFDKPFGLKWKSCLGRVKFGKMIGLRAIPVPPISHAP